MTIYEELTRAFNRGRTRAILSSGQAVVIHRLAVMSKDGDWILRETPEDLDHVLEVLHHRHATYRFGAPLDVRWMRGGWSSHFEFRRQDMRVRADFVTRPPRIPARDLERIWQEQEARDLPVTDVADLIEIKKTNREKDYAVIGEMARLLPRPEDQLLASRSARDLLRLSEAHPDLVARLVPRRPLLARCPEGREALEAALDAERRELMHRNEERLARYLAAAEAWAQAWPSVSREIAGKPLREAHRIVTEHASGVLPETVDDAGAGHAP